MAAGGVTAAAGVIFVVNHGTHFFPTRDARHRVAGDPKRHPRRAASLESRGSVRTWTRSRPGMDLLLAVLLDRGPLDHDHRHQHLRTDTVADRKLRLVRGRELHREWVVASGGRELRAGAGFRLAPSAAIRPHVRKCAEPLGQHRRRHRPDRGRPGLSPQRHRLIRERVHVATVADRRPLARDRAEAARKPWNRA